MGLVGRLCSKDSRRSSLAPSCSNMDRAEFREEEWMRRLWLILLSRSSNHWEPSWASRIHASIIKGILDMSNDSKYITIFNLDLEQRTLSVSN